MSVFSNKTKEYIDEKLKICLEVPHPFYPLLIFGLLIVVCFSLLLYFAEDSVSGEILHPVEISLEEAREFFSYKPIAKAQVKVLFAQERVYEIEQVRESIISGVEDRGNLRWALEAADFYLSDATRYLSIIKRDELSKEEQVLLDNLYVVMDETVLRFVNRIKNKDLKLDKEVIDYFLEVRQKNLGIGDNSINLSDYLR